MFRSYCFWINIIFNLFKSYDKKINTEQKQIDQIHKMKKRKMIFANNSFDDEIKLKWLSRNQSFLIKNFDEKININWIQNRQIVIKINTIDWTNKFIDCFAKNKIYRLFSTQKTTTKISTLTIKIYFKKKFNNREKNSIFDVIQNQIKNQIINSTKLKKKWCSIFFHLNKTWISQTQWKIKIYRIIRIYDRHRANEAKFQ